MNKLLLYTFSNISNKYLPYTKKFVINSENNESGSKSIADLTNLIITSKPEYIIGIGEYSGRDNKQIRIEQFTNNKFRNNSIGNPQIFELNRIEIPREEEKFLKYGLKMGNSYCNLSAYLISKAINKNKLSTKLIFLHIPSKFPVLKANNLIEKLITNLL